MLGVQLGLGGTGILLYFLHFLGASNRNWELAEALEIPHELGAHRHVILDAPLQKSDGAAGS